MIRPPHIILRNASMRGCSPAMTCLAVTDGVISGIGRERDVVGSADRDTIVIDCGGQALLPGIIDEHCHIFAAAATSSGVDCRPAATPTVDAVVRALRTARVRSDGWIRGYGYDDSPLGLGRHLDRRDLDAVGVDIPIRGGSSLGARVRPEQRRPAGGGHIQRFRKSSGGFDCA